MDRERLSAMAKYGREKCQQIDVFLFLGQHVAKIDQVSVTALLEPRVKTQRARQNYGQHKKD